MRRLWNLRQLIIIMVHRDLFGRYKGSLMGAFWPVINPLGHLLLYTFIFNLILNVRFGKDPSTANFALYLMTGLVPWGAFAEAVARAPNAIVEVPNLVKRVVFPTEILPFVIALSSQLSQLMALGLLIVTAALYIHTVHWTLVFLPVVMLSHLLFTTGLSWLFSSLGVYIRDLHHIIALALSAWMYATPIVYPASKFPAYLYGLVLANPLAGIVEDYRRIILEGSPPNWPIYALYTCIGLITWFVGFAFFHKTKRSFADVI